MFSLDRSTSYTPLDRALRYLTLTLLLACTAGPAAADDNVLGLPKPREARRPGAVLLYGGGLINNEAWDRFLALAGGPKAHIVIVPSAGYRCSDYDTDAEFQTILQRRFRAWMALVTNNKVASVEFLYTDDPEDANSETFVKPLTKATAVWFSGGQQGRLGYRFVGERAKPTKFQAALRDLLERGGVVGGTSAGMAAMPEVMTVDEDRPGNKGPMHAVVAHGFGLLTGAIVEQHFDTRVGRLERFTGLLRDSDQLDQWTGRTGTGAKMVGLAVAEDTGLLLQGDRVEVLGGRNAHVFLKSAANTSLTWHMLKAGEKAELKRDRRGDVTLSREGVE